LVKPKLSTHPNARAELIGNPFNFQHHQSSKTEAFPL
jgi:hypothetical protein